MYFPVQKKNVFAYIVSLMCDFRSIKILLEFLCPKTFWAFPKTTQTKFLPTFTDKEKSTGVESLWCERKQTI